MSKIRKILDRLAESNSPCTVEALVLNDPTQRRAVSRELSRLHKENRVSKLRVDGRTAAYFLTSDQKAQVSMSPAERRKRYPADGLSPAQISERLRFLSDLSGRPAFLGHAVLEEIKGDYRRALERSVETEDQAS